MSGRTRHKPHGQADTNLDVFINCPFSPDHKPFFYATVFTIVRSGYRARCALEADDAGENRLGKIIEIIRQCTFSVHDISLTEADGDPPLPRFNMPLELGLWLGAKAFGTGDQRHKRCIVLDREKHRFQRYISDIAGQDIRSHDGKVEVLISELANWLRGLPGGVHAGGGTSIMEEYQVFEGFLPQICKRKSLTVEEVQFSDFTFFATEFVGTFITEKLTLEPA